MHRVVIPIPIDHKRPPLTSSWGQSYHRGGMARLGPIPEGQPCWRTPTPSGVQLVRWSFGGGNPGLNRPHGYLVQRVGAFLVRFLEGNFGTPQFRGTTHAKQAGA